MGKVLVIVDIQRSMGHWFRWSYLQKVYSFLNQHTQEYDRVLMILEPDIAVQRKIIPDVETASIQEIERLFAADREDSVPSFLLGHLTDEPLYKQYHKGLFERMLQLGMIGKDDFIELPSLYGEIGRPYSMYMSQGLKQLVQLVSDASEIHLIGGGLTKCVELTYRLFLYHQLPVKVLPKQCYEIRFINSNYHRHNVFDTNPIKNIPKKLLENESKMAMTKIENKMVLDGCLV